ncbi:ABC transporter permease subunit [Zavarzinia compransoris]|uniref:ABC transporter permease subunit n=1 Tax=Zavarzinia marina TaxID=2911065 RepID=UPI001F25F032|nr:ABC transporter permease subunit [Zavarzinia marina]MCF4165782.1 ABC transporter permease subunit [Zavarzinia marina]
MKSTLTIARRELAGYFATPLAYVFIIVYLFLTGIFTFYVGNFFARGEADLVPFFTFHPWLYLFLIPAIAMRLWAEERKAGTIELLLTLPVPLWAAILGKFLAAWAFTAIALVLTAPMWITVNYLGAPDNGVILAGYIGSFLMAGAYLAVGSCVSAMTRNQVVAFVLTVVVLFLFTASGAPMVLDAFSGWAPQAIVDTVASFSFLTHFDGLVTGVIEVKDIVFFASLIVAALAANAIVIDMKKAS